MSQAIIPMLVAAVVLAAWAIREHEKQIYRQRQKQLRQQLEEANIRNFAARWKPLTSEDIVRGGRRRP